MACGIIWFIAGAGAAAWWAKRGACHKRRREAWLAQNYAGDAGAPPHADAWDSDRGRVVNSIADLPEATLDTVLVAVQAMRNRLAESRALRSPTYTSSIPPSHPAHSQHAHAVPQQQQAEDPALQSAGDLGSVSRAKAE